MKESNPGSCGRTGLYFSIPEPSE